MGHLLQACNIFKYLGKYSNSNLILDPTYWNVNWTDENNEYHPRKLAKATSQPYPDSKIEYPPNMPSPRGMPVVISVFVDADHAGNTKTRRSYTGIIVNINSAPILWYSKRQNTVETSTFGSEIIALKIAVDMIQSLVYKLRMFGVLIGEKTRVFCDKMSVVNSGTKPDCRLKKKHNLIAFHKIREAVASGEILIYYERSNTNVADLLTKVLSFERRNALIFPLLG